MPRPSLATASVRPASPLGAASALLLGVAAAVGLSSALPTLGRWIDPGEHNFYTDYLVAGVWSLLLGGVVAAMARDAVERRVAVLAWAARTVVVLGAMLGYEWYYYADAFAYFKQALAPDRDLLDVDSWWTGTGLMVTLTRAHIAVLGPSYHAAKVTCAFAGFLGAWAFARAFEPWLPWPRTRLLAVATLFPTSLFWGSILGKDPLIFLGLGCQAVGVSRWLQGRAGALRWILPGLALTGIVRFWVAGIALPPLALAFVLSHAPGRRAKPVIIVAACAAMAAVAVLRTFGTDWLAPEQLLLVLNVVSDGWARGGSALVRESEFGSWWEALRFMPYGAATALYRPLPFEQRNLFGLAAGAESAMLLVAAAWGARAFHWQALRKPVVAWLVAFAVVWASLYAFISPQNLGTAVRFRLQVVWVLLALPAVLAASRRTAPSASSTLP